MAPSKRRRAAIDDGDESDAQVESARSSLRQSRNKRSRVSLAAENGGSVISDEESDEDIREGNYTYTFKNAADESLMDVFNTDDEDDEDYGIDELRATQLVEKHFKEHKENVASEQGIIEEVTMKNFMCHGKLTITLGPLINFIIGHNGSGKSAILTALTLCLGAKATSTNRGGSLKSFIREGEDAAWISVKIKNRGEGSYQPELYGHSVIVERHFNRSGTSGFKIKNSEGRVVTTKRADLEDICDYFALQLDNPMNVLSQDAARQFLNSSSPSDKYKFFIKGTQLEQLDRDYRLMEDHLDETEVKGEAREEDIAVLGNKAQEAEAKKKLMDRSATLDTKITELGWMHAWAQIEEQEKELANLDDDIRRADGGIADLQTKVETESRVFDELHQTHGANQGVIDDLERELFPAREHFDEIKQHFERNKADLLNNQGQKRRIQQDIKGAVKDAAIVQTKLDQERTRIDNANGPAHARRLEELEEARARHQDLQEQMREHTNLKPQMDREKEHATAAVSRAQPGLEEKREAVRKAEQLVTSLESDKGEHMSAFPRQIHDVVRAINSETRWRDKPVGPMGNHVRLLKQDWGSIIETTFGGQMNAFVVTNKQDHQLLSQILRSKNCFSNVLIGDPRHIDTSRNEPDPQYDTILRVLEIDNDLVRNQLIIAQAIEQTVLIRDRKEALRFSESRPHNVRATIAMHDTERGCGIRFDTTRSGAAKSGPVHAWRAKFRMKANSEEQIRLQKEVVMQLRREANDVQVQLQQLQATSKHAGEALFRHDRDAKSLRVQLQRADDHVQELDAAIQRDSINDTGVLEELQEQLSEAHEQQQAARDSYQDMVNEMDKLNDLARGIKEQLDAATLAVKEQEAKINKAKEKLEKRKDGRDQALRRKNFAIEQVEHAQQEKAEIEQRRQAKARMLETEYIPQAEQICRRIPVEDGMTPDIIDKKLDRLIDERNKFQQRAGGNKEQILDAWAATRRAFKAAKKDLDELKILASDLKGALIYRKQRWYKFRRHISSRAKINFQYLLNERNFRGRILMDHKQKELDINVEPDMHKASDSGRQTKSLSGGEKSFSTICLLLSIWEAMGSPIRCLDEFDVFMDHANREISMKMMVQAAARSVGRQFILITPQAMTAVEDWQSVKCHRMTDPERGQTNLSFGS